MRKKDSPATLSQGVNMSNEGQVDFLNKLSQNGGVTWDGREYGEYT
jgi:hypothetical protein